MKKLLLILCLLSCFYLNGNEELNTKYSRYLEAVEPSEEGFQITLTPNLVFNWNPQPFENQMLTPWKKGDAIAIHIYNESLVLFDASAQIFYAPQVTLNEASIKNLPVIEKISFHTNYSNFNSQPDLMLYLSDGSTWIYENVWDFEKEAFENWQEGDSILINQEEIDEDGFSSTSLLNYTWFETSLADEETAVAYFNSYDPESDDLGYIEEDEQETY